MTMPAAGAVDRRPRPRRLPGAHRARAILERDAIALFEKLGLKEHLTPQRSNGFRSMVERIRADARATLAEAA